MPLYPPSKLDQHQIIQHAFDEANQRLRTDATLNVNSSAVEVIISHLNDSVRLGDGTGFLTSSTIGPKLGLDVNIINTTSTIITDGTDTLAMTPSGEALVRDNDANTTLSSIDSKLIDGNDIGDVTINNGAGAFAVNIQDGGNSLTVDAINLDIRDLSHTIDSIKIGDGSYEAGVTPLNDLKTADVPNQPGLDTTLMLSTTPVEGKVGSSALSERKYIEMQALTTNVKWGYTTTCPFDLFKNQFFALPCGTNCKIYFKAASGTAQVSFAEK